MQLLLLLILYCKLRRASGGLAVYHFGKASGRLLEEEGPSVSLHMHINMQDTKSLNIYGSDAEPLFLVNW